METIRNYLETMFQNLPDVPEVQKAKYELGQMMEDKYQELLSDGKSDNEAVAVVISEFGNLDELADELGIESAMQENAIQTRRLGMQEAKSYLSEKTKYAWRIAFGILLCILSPCACVLTTNENEMTAAGMIPVAALFLMIAVAVGFFVYAHLGMEKWRFLKTQACSIDFATAEYVHNEMEHFRMTWAILLTVGIALCVFCIVPVLLTVPEGPLTDEYGICAMFLCIAVGVFMIVASSIKKGAYGDILKLNAKGTMGAGFVPSQKEQIRYANPQLEKFMSVYWLVILVIYLSWSFITFEWYKTWIIWPITAVIKRLIEALNREK